MRRLPARRPSRVALVLLLALCARASAPGAAPVPAAAADGGPAGLPPVPRVNGALDVRVVSPGAQASVGGRDSTFVFGSVGSGEATLTINGAPVQVAPNGAFLAFLPVPPASAPRYELVATRGVETARRTVPVRVPARRPLPATGRLVVDSGSVSPAGRSALRADEPVRVAVRAPRNAAAWLALGGDAGAPMVDAQARPGWPTPTGEDAATTWVGEVPAGALAAAPEPRVVVARGADTVRLRVGRVSVVAAADPGRPGARDWVQLGRPSAVPDTDRVIVGRPTPDGTYKWFFAPGTPVERTGAQGGATRVRLDAQLEVWVDSGEVVPLPAGWSAARRGAGGARVAPAPGWSDLVIPLAERPPYQVIERGREIDLVLYQTAFSPDILPIWGTAGDSLVRQVVWEQEATDRVRVTLRLGEDPYGYLALWDPARSAFVLRVRRTPTVDPARPLRGMRIVVDAGHPPGGATGPTGLWEPVAVLPVAERVRDLLRERGAEVVMTRTTADPVPLGDRGVLARRADGHAFLSIHLNAFPDGVNPFANAGTSTLFFHQHSEPLARLVQREMVRRFRIRDLGIHYQNLAVARPPWMPAILTEGLFLMFPEQEAALRSPEGRELYARAVVDGTEAYFRSLAR
ncbi:N-acetylmuramoyl-L-alanine amidase [Roseisolibacter sp. H3M3-2]|uniref:N-acetylmuramoyl-L-alanine amidase family protein n=1 Tax=Roseisolibacter sp. H3M3-2 TaxID=3031323 RepID=UPI0023DA005E|nr:N-acetylmuramoyl-L-alanine amidase [Roseisolibacter sp. H3M3-2]MDF1505702.1 N-acetylmuramoyl-L-alanine amidase [Roseisolibacter sp. H3M3-2]